MCTTTKVPSVQQETEVIKTAVRADASSQKANAQNRTDRRGLVSENIKTSNSGLEDDILTSAKEMRPKRSTREFVRQFARCYSFSPTSDATIGGLVLN